ncbi:MAG: MGMT family protein [Ilumatobacter sp.]|jgi:O-6-methylguanine DNA methyltransferase|nr:MGMT family protein [Ilumatobacter sp.]
MEIDSHGIGPGARQTGTPVARQDGQPRDARAFETRVLHAVRRIPRGRVATYGDVAAMSGRARAWRAVGTIMRTCRSPSVPCHRVVGAGGRLGGYSDPRLKRRLLQDEGIIVGPSTIRQFAAVRWTPNSQPVT